MHLHAHAIDIQCCTKFVFVWDFVCLLSGFRLSLKQQAIQLDPAMQHRAETYCLWPHDCPFPLM